MYTSRREKSFWNISYETAISELETHADTGLSEAEAEDRLRIYGNNTIETHTHSSWLSIFIRQFASPLILILMGAVVVTLFIGHFRDAGFISIAVIVNTLLGFYQEHKAERALLELKTYLRQRARVIREGKEYDKDTEELVPGDIIRISQGDRVPADGRLMFINDLQVDEAVLTGESLPVVKATEPVSKDATLGDQTCMVFAGTLVTQGVGTLVVCRTGKDTEFGKIASLIASNEHEETPLQKAIKHFSVKASIILGTLTLTVFIVGIFSGYSVLQMFLTSVAIAVSAIPEGLPIALTVILSVGVQRMAHRKGVVRKLVAAETLGGTTVILTDKTGTLTEARMELTSIIPLEDIPEKTLLARGLLNTRVIIENLEEAPENWRMDGNIMEKALVKGAGLLAVHTTDNTSSEVIQSLPFNAVNKFSVSLVKEDSVHRLNIFGAPDILLSHSRLSTEEKNNIHARIEELASTGKRVLGIAHKDIEPSEDFSLAKEVDISSLRLDGLFVFNDPVRAGVKDALLRVTKAGVRTILMTGDHAGTARAIAQEVGFTLTEKSVLDASELRTLSEDDLKARLPFLQVISRVTPFDKLRIAKLYQEAGEVVAMTGDGVNDAPSIKQADVGIAMGSGTEVSRSVADLVLLDDNFETIVAAIEEGRQIMGNIRKVLVYLLSNVTDGLILIGGSLVFGLTLPLNPLQILWVNFFSGSFPAIAFAFEREDGVLHTKPQRMSGGLFSPLMKFLILTIGISTSALLFILYWGLLTLGFEEQLVRTFIFASFATYTLFVSLSVRSLEKSIFSYPLFSNTYLLWGIGIGLTLTALGIYLPMLQSLFQTVPLPFTWILAVFGLGILNIAIIETGKFAFRKSKIRSETMI